MAPGYVAIGTQLLSRPGPPDQVTAGQVGAQSPDAEAPGGSWDERVPPPGCDATLLAVVPVPGTTTSLAIVAYAISTADARQDPPETTGASGAPPRRLPAAPGSGRAGQAGSGLVVDHLQRRVWADGAEVELTFQEYELLAFLSAHPARVFSRAELVQRVWARGPVRDDPAPERRNVGRDSRTVDVHVSRLRRRLGPVYGQYLVTEYRAGYQFRPMDA